MNSIRLVLAVTAISFTSAATAAVDLTPGVWDGYKGTRIVVDDMPTEAACAQELEKLGPGNYTCRTITRVVVTEDPPVCGPAPENEVRTQACPQGTTGSWTQTRAYVSAPHPTCWTAGPWTPSAPPEGACVKPQPPQTERWVFCADEDRFCSFTGTRRVRYGANNTWVVRDVTARNGGVRCNNETWGDPLHGVVKRCEILETGAQEPPQETPPPVQNTGTARLRWQAPTQNVDGSALNDLAGYLIHYGSRSTVFTHTVDVPNASVTSYVIENLAPGTYYFAVRAYTTSGARSDLSNVASKAIQQ